MNKHLLIVIITKKSGKTGTKMLVILRSNNYKMAKCYADELKTVLSNVLLEAENSDESDEILYKVSIQEQDREKAQIIIERVTKELSKEFKIVDRTGESEWDRNTVENSSTGGEGFKHWIGNVFSESGTFTILVSAVCIVLFLAQLLGFGSFLLPLMMHDFSFADPSSWYKLVTPALLHGGFMHIAFNLAMWIYLGGRIEKNLSLLHLVSLFMLGTVIPNYLQYALYGPNFVGLSGVVFALVGYAWMVSLSQRRIYGALGLPSGFMGFSIVWIMFGLLFPNFFNMANGAHIGGIAIGLLFGLYELLFIKTKGRRV